MKKKVQVKKQITPAFQPGPFWAHRSYTQEDLQIVETFLTNFDKQLKALLIEPTLQDNYRIVCQKIGYDIHPSLGQGKTSNLNPPNPGSVIQELGQKYIIISNHKLDLITLRLLMYVCPLVKLNTIKFSNNNLSNQELKSVQTLVTKDQNISVLMFEWNPIADVEIAKTIVPSFVKTNLNSLIFRSNKIGNALLKELVTKIVQTPDLKLKYLDLYDNNLTQQAIPTLVTLLSSNNTIQHLQLSKNQLESEKTLKQLFDSIGLFTMTNQQLQAHRLLEKQRDDLIEKNKKRKKGTPEQPLPQVPKIEQLNQNWYQVRNSKLKSMNLLWNNIGSSSFNCVKDFLKRMNPISSDKNFMLNLSGNEFNPKEKETLKNRPGVKL